MPACNTWVGEPPRSIGTGEHHREIWMVLREQREGVEQSSRVFARDECANVEDVGSAHPKASQTLRHISGRRGEERIVDPQIYASAAFYGWAVTLEHIVQCGVGVAEDPRSTPNPVPNRGIEPLGDPCRVLLGEVREREVVDRHDGNRMSVSQRREVRAVHYVRTRQEAWMGQSAGNRAHRIQTEFAHRFALSPPAVRPDRFWGHSGEAAQEATAVHPDASGGCTTAGIEQDRWRQQLISAHNTADAPVAYSHSAALRTSLRCQPVVPRLKTVVRARTPSSK